MEILLLKFYFFNYVNVYISTPSSLSKAPSNCFNFFSKCAFIPLSSIKLEGDLKPTLESIVMSFIKL